jgi:hypothetical protein
MMEESSLNCSSFPQFLDRCIVNDRHGASRVPEKPASRWSASIITDATPNKVVDGGFQAD